MAKRLLSLLLFIAIAASGYSQNSSSKADIDKLKTDNELLQAKVQTLEAKLDLLKMEIENLKNQVAAIKSQPSGSGQTTVSQPSSGSSGNQQVYKSQTPSAPSSGSGGQCTAITKAGKRCSRAARSNGLCWQHGG